LFPTVERGVEVKLKQVLFGLVTKSIECNCLVNYVDERNTLVDVLIIIRAKPLEHPYLEAINRLFRLKSEKIIKGTIRPMDFESLLEAP